MHSELVLDLLKKHGQLLDAEIASVTKLSLADVRESLEVLSGKGEISQCKITRFSGNKQIDGIQCRISGFTPSPAPGRKPAAKSQG